MGKELILPVVLGSEDKPLLNLKVMRKPTFVPSEPPIKKKGSCYSASCQSKAW